MSASEIVNKVWNYAHVLRDDGVGYGDYVEQITYLIFLKMADEREYFRTSFGVSSSTSSATLRSQPNYTRAKLVKLDGDDLELQYRHTLENLGKLGGMLGTIFRKAQNKTVADHPWPAPYGQPSVDQICSRQICQDPAKLERLIKMIDKEQWSTLPADVKGGAGQYSARASCFSLPPASMQSFTPRPLIQAMVEVMQPAVQGRTNVAGGRKPGATNSGYVVADPACGTGGFYWLLDTNPKNAILYSRIANRECK